MFWHWLPVSDATVTQSLVRSEGWYGRDSWFVIHVVTTSEGEEGATDATSVCCNGDREVVPETIDLAYLREFSIHWDPVFQKLCIGT